MAKLPKDDDGIPRQLADPEMGAVPHISHFGALKAAPTIPVIKGNFAGSAIDDAVWAQTLVSGGTITVQRGVGQLKTGTNAAGSVKLISNATGRFEAGQVTVYQSGVYAGAPVASNIRRWGVMDATEQNGLFFELNGTDFRVVARAGGTDTAVAQAAFSGDQTFTPGASNNTYRIHYSAGRALFQRASAGKIVLLHAMVDSAFPLVEDLDLNLFYENTNTGNTTDVEMRVRGASSSVFGALQQYRSGAALVFPFEAEVAFGNVSGYEMVIMRGRNPAITTATDPEDITAIGGNYPGFDATANENLEALSDDAADAGTVVSSGTATGGTLTTLVDTGADFVSDGVSVGDALVNDTRGSHGSITAVTATQLTVFRMEAKPGRKIQNVSGDSYRVVTPASTGAALIRVERILNASFAEQVDKYIVLNGASGVTSTVDAMRCTKAMVALAGSGGGNAGIITVRQAVTTANVFTAIPVGFNESMVAAYTVPAGKDALMRRFRVSIARANGAAGSATATIRARRKGEVFGARGPFEIQTGGPASFKSLGGEVEPAGTDIKIRIDEVSDNTTIADGAIEMLVRDV